MRCFLCSGVSCNDNNTKDRALSPTVYLKKRSVKKRQSVDNTNNGHSESMEMPSNESQHISAQTFTFPELLAATKNFRADCFLGEGGFGKVYKGWLESSNQVVAIKQLDRDGLQGNREFLVEVLMLSLLHHPNLVNLIGYCAYGDQRLLVYEYMALGSLDVHLHDPSPEKQRLDWNTRMKIAAGAAKGLEYLHDKASPPVIYRDLKCSNILLGDGYFPKLSDFGLAKLGPVGDNTHVSTRVMGTYGYCAPEYAMTGQLTVKSDIYSFGVVLLEIITGRRAIDNSRRAVEQNLVAWARPLFKDRRMFAQMADPMLRGQYPVRGFYQALAVAAMCVQEEPTMRPSIADVKRAFNSPQRQYLEHLPILKLMPSSLSAGIFRAASFPSHLRSPFLHPKKKDPSSILHGSVLKVTDTVYRRIPASNSILTYSIMYRCRVGRNGVARSRIANWQVGIRSSIASFAGGVRKWAEGGVVEVEKSEGSRQERSSHHPHLQHQLLTEKMEEEKDGGYKQPEPQQQLGVSYSKLLTLPTVLTLGRVAAVPLLVTTYHMNGSWATTTTTGIFLVAAFTDWLDGYLARKMRLGTTFGAFLDPVADKLMVATTLVLLCTEPLDVAFFGAVPWILTAPAIAIIGREITMSAVREWAASQNNRILEAVAVNNLGKWKTATQMTALTILLFTRDPSSLLGASFLVSAGVLLLYISAGLALCSLAVYMRNIWRFLIK